MITLSRGWGMSLLAAIWTMATAGILTILFWRNHPHWIRVTLYVLMGWLAAAALPALYSALGISGMVWMVAGGLAYTFGIYFYANGDQSHRVWPGVLTGHDIWHLFVLTGSICHYILIFAYVAR
jgi:hemolysin III